MSVSPLSRQIDRMFATVRDEPAPAPRPLPAVDLRALSGGACRRLPGPCPHRSCRYHLAHEESAPRRGPTPVGAPSTGCVFEVIEDGREMTLAEVGTYIGLTRERVRQIINQTLRRARTKARDRGVGP